MPSSLRQAAAALLFISLVVHSPAAQSRKRPQPVCEPERALELVRQQLSEAKAFTEGTKRVTVMSRAADLLWPYEEAQAREVFAEAFEVASAHYKEHGQEFRERKPARQDAQIKGLTYIQTDPRVIVIRAVTRRDPAWAQRLTARSAEETRQRVVEAEEKARREGGAGEKLLSLARSLMGSEQTLALSVARESLRHPASRSLSSFIYEVARQDRAAADAFYADALRAYAGGDLASLLQISAYPFGLLLNLGLRHGYNAAGVPPPGFVPNPELQQQFVAAFLRAAERSLGAGMGQPPPEDGASQPSEAEMVYAALTALDKLYVPADKSFAARIAPLRQTAAGMLSANLLRRAEANGRPLPPSNQPQDTSGLVERVLEQAGRFKEPDQHDRHIVTGLWSALRVESFERLQVAAERLKDEEVRRQFLDAVYFEKALGAARGGRPDEAARWAERVGSLGQRAALAWEVASAELKSGEAAPLGVGLAESVYKSAQGAPESEERAKSLLGVAHVYGRLEPGRAQLVLAEAVSAINRVPDIDLSRTFITRAVEGRTFNFFTSHPAPGFSLESGLRELARRDFETALGTALALDDKYLRALAVVSLASQCLEDAPPPEKPARPARPAPAKRPEAAPKTQAPAKKRP